MDRKELRKISTKIIKSLKEVKKPPTNDEQLQTFLESAIQEDDLETLVEFGKESGTRRTDNWLSAVLLSSNLYERKQDGTIQLKKNLVPSV